MQDHSQQIQGISRRDFIILSIFGVVGAAATLLGADTVGYFNQYRGSRTLSKSEYDCAIVGGYGIGQNEELPLVGEKRVDAGVELYFDKRVKRLLLTEGKRSSRGVSGARVMGKYAMEKSAPSSAIVLEEKANTSLGNAYYTKVDHLIQNKWSNNVLVTSRNHMPRLKWCFDRFLGPEFVTDAYSENSGLYGSTFQELIYLTGYRVVSADISDGNHEALAQRFQKFRIF